MLKVSPSILSADFLNLQHDIEKVAKDKADLLHIDIMDGNFVPNISFGWTMLEQIRKVTDLFLDVHLMIVKPNEYLEQFIHAGADLIDVHVENTQDIDQIIKKIHAAKIKVGLVVNPETKVEKVLPYLDQIDQVLVMTVHPGFGGQQFIPECLTKIAYLNQLRKNKQLNYQIEVDGGINETTAKQCYEKGTDIVVAGSYVFKNDTKNAIETLHKVSE